MAEWIYNQEDTPLLAKNDECKVCDGKNKSTHYALCEKCLYYFHPTCLGMKGEEVLALPLEVPFHCTDCSKSIEEVVQRDDRTEIVQQQPLNDISFDEAFNTGGDDNDDYFNTDTNSQSQTIENNKSTQESSNTDIGTDEEGYKEVDYFKDHRIRNGQRKFLVVYKDEEEEWVREEDCDGSVDFLNIYCRAANIPESTISYKEGCGAVGNRKPNKKLWASIDRILDMVISYGNKAAIQPKIFSRLDTSEDSLQLMQIGSHCFGLLYLAKLKTCFLADGQNAFINHLRSRKLVLTKLSGAKFIKCLVFNGQKEEDQCASSAAAITIEFQRLYNVGQIPQDPLQVSVGQLERIRKVLHKGSGEKINNWSPIIGEAWKIKCNNCGAKFKTKNRGALNLHRCV